MTFRMARVTRHEVGGVLHLHHQDHVTPGVRSEAAADATAHATVSGNPAFARWVSGVHGRARIGALRCLGTASETPPVRPERR